MTALSQPTAIDGYRWLKNDIIRGTYQPDEKLRMSLLTARYALGVGPLREALSQLVAERLVTVVNQKGYRVASMSEAELLDIFDARANMEAMLVRLAIERGDDAWEAEILARPDSHYSSGIRNTCPGYIFSGLFSIGLFASKILLYRLALPYTCFEIALRVSPDFTV